MAASFSEPTEQSMPPAFPSSRSHPSHSASLLFRTHTALGGVSILLFRAITNFARRSPASCCIFLHALCFCQPIFFISSSFSHTHHLSVRKSSRSNWWISHSERERYCFSSHGHIKRRVVFLLG